MPPRAAPSTSHAAPSGPGILQINPAHLQPLSAKVAARVKVIVRRLPPGLTREEFENVIPNEFKVGAGKVDWLEYRQGKIKSPGKHPEQSRVYLHFTNEAHVRPFESGFLTATFHDAKGTWRHPDLKHLPPTLEFAPCQRVPSSKPRIDNRQGLIDQDHEYMAFLESETHVAPKASALDAAPRERTKELVTSTPLIEALREKKAAKAKAAAAKASKQPKDDNAAGDKTKTPSGKARKAEEPKAAVKPDTKHKAAPKPTTNDDKASSNGTASPPPARKRERPPTNIKSMLQRDLGLAPGPRRGASGTSLAAEKSTVAAQLNGVPTGPGTATPKGPKSARKDKPAPTDNKTSPSAPSQTSTPSKVVPPKTTSTPAPTARPSKPAPRPSPGATKAYLKHANASQGVTDELLRAALAHFGQLLSMDIDKRKGTALAEFKSSDSLVAAMAKRTVSVGSGAVEVLEYKDRSGAQIKATPSTPRGISARGRGRGGGHAGAERGPPISVGGNNGKGAPG